MKLNLKKTLFLNDLCFDSDIRVGSHKYASLFTKNGYEVFNLSHFISISKFLRRSPKDKKLIKSWRRGIQVSNEGIFFYTPLCLFPYLNLPILDNLRSAHNCLQFCYPDLRKILKERGFLNIDLLFINNIKLISVLRFVKPRMIIFRISDRIEGFKNTPRTISILQKEVIKTSNLIFATSKNLQQEASKINKNTLYLPNGVDEKFIMAADEKYPHPEEFKNIKTPIVIYIGTISDWFDYKLYEYGIAKSKNISFVMIGPISGTNYNKNMANIQRYVRTYRNFYYLGPRPHSELKKYLAYADIGVIPFRVNSLTNEINPVKLFEYVAYGLPVIASHMTELQNYAEYVSCYKYKEEYVGLISNYLNKKRCLAQKLIEFAHSNTWEKRFEFMLSQIEKLKI